MRQAIIRRKLEDGSIEEILIDLPSNEAKSVSRKKKDPRKQSDEDNEKQEEIKTSTTSKAVVEITRSEG